MFKDLGNISFGIIEVINSFKITYYKFILDLIVLIKEPKTKEKTKLINKNQHNTMLKI